MVEIVPAEIFIIKVVYNRALCDNKSLAPPVHVINKHPYTMVVLVELMKSHYVITIDKADETSFIDDALTSNVNLVIFFTLANLNMLHCKDFVVYFTRGLVHCSK